MTNDEVQVAIEKIKQASIQALVGGNFALGVELANAAESLSGWVQNGMAGDPPVDVNALLSQVGEPRKAVVPVAEQSEATTEEVQQETEVSDEAVTLPMVDIALPLDTSVAPIPEEPAAEAAPQEPPMEPGLLELFRQAEELSNDWKGYNQALQNLEVVEQSTQSPTLQKKAAELKKSIEQTRQNRLEELIRRAKSIPPGESTLEDQETAWNQVKLLEEKNAEAAEALQTVAVNKQVRYWKSRINMLRLPLQSEQKDLRDVEAARREASQYLAGGEIPTPELSLEMERVHQQLDKLRNEILEASVGAASGKRAADYESSIAKFRAALDAGYVTIQDDTTGEYINVVDMLRETRLSYWADLRARAGQRKQDAEKSLQDGYPETAVAILKEAQGLVLKIEEGGEEIRKNVEVTLAQAQEELANKSAAQTLVNQAEAAADPETALALVQQAEVAYPKYPEIKQKIEERQGLAVSKVVRDMVNDLALAQGALSAALASEDITAAQSNFERARQYVSTADQRGANLKISNPEREAKRTEVQAMLVRIQTEESAHYTFLNKLLGCDKALREKDASSAYEILEELSGYVNDPRVQVRRKSLRRLRLMERLSKVDEAVEEKNERSARMLMDEILASLTDEERLDAEILARENRITSLKNDQDQYIDAWERFLNQQYESVIAICKGLIKESVRFRDQSQTLLNRSQGRMKLQEARLARQGGSVEALQKSVDAYEALLELRTSLPPEDQTLIQTAENELRVTTIELDRCKELLLRFEAIKELRRGKAPQWLGWVKQVKALLTEAPGWMKPDVEVEYRSGGIDWVQLVMMQSETHESMGQIRKAYDTMLPLVENGLIDANHALWGRWRRLEYLHYHTMAEQALAGMQPEEWTEAEKYALEARNKAPEEKLREAQLFFLDTTRTVSLRSAQLQAVGSSEGPRKAVELLESKMSQYPILKSDSQMRAYLVRYNLEMKEYAKAEEQARTFAYVSGEEAFASLWRQLVEAARDFDLGITVLRGNEGVDHRRLVKSITTLVEARKNITGENGASKSLTEFFKNQIETALKQVREIISDTATSLNTTDLINRIQALDLLLQLDPSDTSANTELRMLADQLGNLVPTMRTAAQNLALGTSLKESLRNGRRLHSELSAVYRTLMRLSHDMAGNLAASVETVKGIVQNWLQIEELLNSLEAPGQIRATVKANESVAIEPEKGEKPEEIEDTDEDGEEKRQLWKDTISRTWNVRELKEVLNRVKSLDQMIEETTEYKYWAERESVLSEVLDGAAAPMVGEEKPGLRELLRCVRTAWENDQFTDLGRNATELRNGLIEGRARLGDPRLTIPHRTLDFNDPFHEPYKVDSLDVIIQKANVKESNRKTWEDWETRFNGLIGHLEEMQEQINHWRDEIPPQLTNARLKIDELVKEWAELRNHVDNQPMVVLSATTKKLLDTYARELLLQNVDDQMDEVDKQIRDLERKLEPVRALARKIKEFTQGARRPLANAANRKQLVQMLTQLRNLDCSHPYLKEYGCMLAKLFNEQIEWLSPDDCTPRG